jgi:hypothetical protein
MVLFFKIVHVVDSAKAKIGGFMGEGKYGVIDCSQILFYINYFFLRQNCHYLIGHQIVKPFYKK